DQQALQVVAGHVLSTWSAETHDLSRGDHRFQAGHPAAGHAVLEGMRTARVGGEIAADLRLLGRSRVGWKEQAALAHDAAKLGGAEPRLDPDPPQQRVERP